ncbi:MAG: class I SAM-dependent methyltransferase [Cryobacterium sp.]|uniref:class I SAM-dependent methyltransferase n=1 Tax=unclassified Cryobacterium TaxID=2649013 RepID=UPI0018C917E7|nr:MULTISPECIES: methyltransferase domain-containing protein [unclassified Cryobacterium]MCY7403888.1 class I SAM-dependent methyltransferase [Cryobacterium sp.]MEC5155798.1 SAM-dependent methyltransferase [Cryobacterium sp. CAN_C3]
MTIASPRVWDQPADRTPTDRAPADRAPADGATADHRGLPTTFGAGGSEPYAQALQGEDNVLYLHGHRTDADPGAAARVSTMHAGRWSAGADAIDRALVAGVAGPVLDIGCGPGRMIQAALDEGLDAFGVDVSPTAVRIALIAGLAVLQRSVFDYIPLEGTWATLLLVDGNIGIGGDPDALLDRCVSLLAADGVLVVEVHRDPEHDLAYEGTLHDAAGHTSDAFPWAEIGVSALRRRAANVGLVQVAEWTRGGRSFARFARA